MASTQGERLTAVEEKYNSLKEDVDGIKSEMKDIANTLNKTTQSQDRTQTIVENLVKSQSEINDKQDVLNNKLEERDAELDNKITKLECKPTYNIKEVLDHPTIKNTIKFIGFILLLVLVSVGAIKVKEVNDALDTYKEIQQVINTEQVNNSIE